MNNTKHWGCNCDECITESAKNLIEKALNGDFAALRKIAAAETLLEAVEYVIQWHREHDSGEGELFGLDFVTECISARRIAIGPSEPKID